MGFNQDVQYTVRVLNVCLYMVGTWLVQVLPCNRTNGPYIEVKYILKRTPGNCLQPMQLQVAKNLKEPV